MLQKGGKYRFTVIGITQDGCGIGMVEGLKVFIDGVLPKETVEAEIIRINDGFAAAKLITLVNPIYERVAPLCSHFGSCGGCSLQHIKYSHQLKLKRDTVCEALERIAGLDSSIVRETIGMENPVRYRNKAAYRVGSHNGAGVIGFSGVRSRSAVEVKDCLMQHDISTRIKETIGQYITQCDASVYNPETGNGLIRHVVTRVGFESGEAMAVVVVNGNSLPQKDLLISLLNSGVPQLKSLYLNINMKNNNAVLGDEYRLLYGKPYINDFIGNLRFEISPQSFFQVNSVQTKVLYDKVMDYAGLTGGETVVDLYSGIGTISLYLSGKAVRVYGVEAVEQAVDDAGRNAAQNRIENVQFLYGRAEAILPRLWHQGVRPSVVVTDPPRKGCNKRVLDTIADMEPDKVIYVSCNPSTMARDIVYLQRRGYRLSEVQPVDMFPHTSHVESIILMTYCGSKGK